MKKLLLVALLLSLSLSVSARDTPYGNWGKVYSCVDHRGHEAVTVDTVITSGRDWIRGQMVLGHHIAYLVSEVTNTPRTQNGELIARVHNQRMFQKNQVWSASLNENVCIRLVPSDSHSTLEVYEDTHKSGCIGGRILQRYTLSSCWES